jgi:hypothetical protein
MAFGPGRLYFTDLIGEEGFDEALSTAGGVYTVAVAPEPLEPPCSTIRASSPAFALARNPARGALAFRLDLGVSAPVEVAVFDVSGRLVAETRITSASAGKSELGVGRDLASGVYLYRARVGAVEASGKAVLLR